MDTHAAVVRLTEAGMTEPQATAIVSSVRLAVDDGVATKADLTNLATKADLTNLATKAELANLATKTELANLAIKDELANLATKADLANLKAEMTRLVLISSGAIIAAMVAMLKL